MGCGLRSTSSSEPPHTREVDPSLRAGRCVAGCDGARLAPELQPNEHTGLCRTGGRLSDRPPENAPADGPACGVAPPGGGGLPSGGSSVSVCRTLSMICFIPSGPLPRQVQIIRLFLTARGEIVEEERLSPRQYRSTTNQFTNRHGCFFYSNADRHCLLERVQVQICLWLAMISLLAVVSNLKRFLERLVLKIWPARVGPYLSV